MSAHERIELAETVSTATSGAVTKWAIADAILAAGYSKPRTITTAEELDALPEGSAVLDADHDVSTKHDGRWHGYEMFPLLAPKFAKCGPFTVLYIPEES